MKNHLFIKKFSVFIVLFIILFFSITANSRAETYITKAQCEAQGGKCNPMSNNCSADEDSIGICHQSGPMAQGACCKPKPSELKCNSGEYCTSPNSCTGSNNTGKKCSVPPLIDNGVCCKEAPGGECLDGFSCSPGSSD